MASELDLPAPAAPARRPEPGCPRRGRHLDDTRDPEILHAALELLVEHGYDRLTIEAIAARARAGKATIYRRWPSKAELVVDAVACVDCVDDVDCLGRDTGSLRGDLRAAFLDALTGIDEFRVGLMSGLLTALRRNPDLAKVVEERIIGARLSQLKAVFERARDRGEVAEGHDLDLLASVAPALLFYRLLLSSKPLTRRHIGRVIDEVILPLAGAPVPGKARRKATP